MIKKYITLLLFLIVLIIIVVFGVNILFSSEDKTINVKVDDKDYNLPLGSSFKDLKEEFDDEINNQISDEAILKDNQEIESSNDSGKISINKASLEELMTLPGIGEKTAQKIIEYRESYGSFWNIEDIKNVKGIGDKKFEKLKDYISI